MPNLTPEEAQVNREYLIDLLVNDCVDEGFLRGVLNHYVSDWTDDEILEYLTGGV